MEILSVRLTAINPTSRPQQFLIPARPNQDHTIGRSSFSTGDDTIISRRHARFSINAESGFEKLLVTNLSLINGILVNFTPVLPFQGQILYDDDEICFSGAHGLTERINAEDLASEAERYRYRVVLERGTRNEMIPRKRENETIIYGRDTKRQRIDVIDLSSDGEEPPRPPPVASGRRVSPVSIGSSTTDDDSSNSDEDLENTLVEEKGETNDTSPESSTSSIDKGKGKEVFVDFSLDFQEELECFICSTLLLVPYICSPCGHGACGPCIYKWREKSDQCPQCRIKLSKEEPFLRDYILERIAEKYAKLTFSTEELVQREIQTTAFHQSQRQKKENEEKKPTGGFISWAARAEQLGIPIPHQQRTITAERVIGRQNEFPPAWDEMDPRAKAQFLHWRNDCMVHHNLQHSNPRRPHGRPMGVERRNQTPPNGPPWWASRRSTGSVANPNRRGHRPFSPEFEPHRQRTAAEASNPLFHTIQSKEVPSHIRLPYQPIPPPSIPQPVDPEWLREVSQAFGPEGVAQVRNDQLRVIHAQNKRGYRPPQIVHAPHPPPSQLPVTAQLDPGRMTEFTGNAMMRDAMMRAVQGRGRSTPNPPQMNVSGQTEM